MKQKIKKSIKYIILVLVLGIVGILSFVSFALPDVGEPEIIEAEITDERIERGRYLAHSVSVCMDCHSTRDWTKFSGPIVNGTLGQGGEQFNQSMGFPGKFYAPNITPYALGGWTDGEILRAISSGVSKSGRALFPVMPHPNYGKLGREDLYSIIAYIRTLAPVKHDVPESEPDFPMNFIINTIPQKPAYSKIPDRNNVVEYGAYLFTAAACNECHTKKDKGTPVPGMELAGGFEFPMPPGTVRSANITSDDQTGLGKWTEEMFVNRFKSYQDSTFNSEVGPKQFNTVMPWMMYSTMETEDLKAIYAYLRTVKPVKNKVVKFTAAK